MQMAHCNPIIMPPHLVNSRTAPCICNNAWQMQHTQGPACAVAIQSLSLSRRCRSFCPPISFLDSFQTAVQPALAQATSASRRQSLQQAADAQTDRKPVNELVADYTWYGDADLDELDEQEEAQPAAPRAHVHSNNKVHSKAQNRQRKQQGGITQRPMQSAGSVTTSDTFRGVVPLGPWQLGSGMVAESSLAAALQLIYGGKEAPSSSGIGLGGSVTARGVPPSALIPPRFQGTVEVHPAPGGRGWGVFAADMIEPGEPLLVSEPLAMTQLPATSSGRSGASPAASGRGGRSKPKQQLQTPQPNGNLDLSFAGVDPPADAVQRLVEQLQELQRALPSTHSARKALGSLCYNSESQQTAPGQQASAAPQLGAMQITPPRLQATTSTSSKVAGPPPWLAPGFHSSPTQLPSAATAIISAAGWAAAGSSSASAPGHSHSTRPTHRPSYSRLLSQPPDLTTWEPSGAMATKGGQHEADGGQEDWDSSSSIWTMRLPQEGSADTAETSSSSSSTQGLPLLSHSQLTSLVKLNAWSGCSTDPSLASSRGEQHVALAGVWPESGLVNHSCAPNATQLLVGGRMIIRASTAIYRGEEVTVSYLGSQVEPGGEGDRSDGSRLAQDLLLSPLCIRRAALHRRWGFTCRCPRCKLEETHAQGLGGVIEAAYHAGLDLAARLAALKAAAAGKVQAQPQSPGQEQGAPARRRGRPRKGEQPVPEAHQQSAAPPVQIKLTPPAIRELRALEAEALQVRQALHAAVQECEEVRHNNKAVAQMLVGASPLYRVITQIREALSPGSPDALAALHSHLTLLGMALPGSQAYVSGIAYLAQQVSDQSGPGDRAALEADRAAVAALTQRYGPCQQDVLELLAHHCAVSYSGQAGAAPTPAQHPGTPPASATVINSASLRSGTVVRRPSRSGSGAPSQDTADKAHQALGPPVLYPPSWRADVAPAAAGPRAELPGSGEKATSGVTAGRSTAAPAPGAASKQVRSRQVLMRSGGSTARRSARPVRDDDKGGDLLLSQLLMPVLPGVEHGPDAVTDASSTVAPAHIQATTLNSNLHSRQTAVKARVMRQGKLQQRAVDDGRHSGVSRRSGGDDDEEGDDELASRLASMFPTLAPDAADQDQGGSSSPSGTMKGRNRRRAKSTSKVSDWAQGWQ